MPRWIDLKGQRFERLTVVRLLKERGKQQQAIWLCRCSCGTTRKVCTYSLRRGKTKSCGCYNRDATSNRQKGIKRPSVVTHGMSKDRFYIIWRGILERVYNKNTRAYKWYGARGIKCEWQDFFSFKRDMHAAYRRHVDKYGAKRTSIDRRDNNGPYAKWNCRWATPTTQSKNKRPRLNSLKSTSKEEESR